MDARTGTNFFKEYLLCLLGSKAVIYVTPQVEFLPVADFMLVIKDVISCSEQEPMSSMLSSSQNLYPGQMDKLLQHQYLLIL